MQKAPKELAAFFSNCIKLSCLHGPLIFYNDWPCYILFISCKFVKGFMRITFLLHVISSWNFHDMCQHFLYNQEQNFSWIWQKMRNSPQSPFIKIAHFCNVMSISDKRWKISPQTPIINGENSYFVSDQAKLLFLSI